MATKKETDMYLAGEQAGRKEILKRVYEALDIEELIADAIAKHEEIYHHDNS